MTSSLYASILDHPRTLTDTQFRDAARTCISHRLPLAVDRRRTADDLRVVPVGILREFARAVASLIGDSDPLYAARKFQWYRREFPCGGYKYRLCTQESWRNRMLSSPLAACAARRDALRCIGWMQHIAEYDCPARRLFLAAEWSRSGLTCYAPEPLLLWRLCPSPHRFNRWVGRVMRRAAQILAPWHCHPSYRVLSRFLSRIHHSSRMIVWDDGSHMWVPGERTRRLPRVRKAAMQLAADVLAARFGESEDMQQQPTRDRLMQFAFHGGLQRDANDVQRPLTTEDFGARGEDDRATIISPRVVVQCDAGMIMASDDRLHRRTVVQVVVTDTTTGLRHHITVPPWFGLPLGDGESPRGRIQAAVAWSFRIDRRAYTPSVEA